MNRHPVKTCCDKCSHSTKHGESLTNCNGLLLCKDCSSEKDLLFKKLLRYIDEIEHAYHILKANRTLLSKIVIPNIIKETNKLNSDLPHHFDLITDYMVECIDSLEHFDCSNYELDELKARLREEKRKAHQYQ